MRYEVGKMWIILKDGYIGYVGRVARSIDFNAPTYTLLADIE